MHSMAKENDDPRLTKFVEEFCEISTLKKVIPSLNSESIEFKLKVSHVPKAIMAARWIPYARRDKKMKKSVT